MTLLKPVRQQKISDQVFEQLKELIFRGRLKPGDQLMPEREMATSMNVSRTTIRNAISRLVTMHLVEHKQGKGTFVAKPDPKKGNPFAAAMSNPNASIYDLLEVRMGLECIAASLAATGRHIGYKRHAPELSRDGKKGNRRRPGFQCRYLVPHGHRLCHQKSAPYTGDENLL